VLVLDGEEERTVPLRAGQRQRAVDEETQVLAVLDVRRRVGVVRRYAELGSLLLPASRTTVDGSPSFGYSCSSLA